MNERVILNDEQIEHLYDFVRSKRVRYIDVQVEIVDHLASGIEDMMTEDPKLAFTQALRDIYSKFPITGFAVMVGERTDAMMRYWNRQQWKIIVDYFKLPKIILTLGFFYAFFQLFFRVEIRSSVLWIALAVVNLILLVIIIRERKKQVVEIGNYLVLESYYNKIVGSNAAIIIFSQLFVDDFDSTITSPMQCAMIACICCYTLFTIDLTLFQFPKKLEEELQTKYKHLSFVS